MRKVASHWIQTPRGGIICGICVIDGDQVVETRPLDGEEAALEWMEGNIVCREEPTENVLHAYYKNQLLKE